MFIDKQTILERTDLLALIGGDLRRKASTNGGEFSGACPFCGGSDRFNVQPYAIPWPLWLCRNCTGGKWSNAIDFVMLRDRVDFKRACEILSGGELLTTRERPKPQPRPAAAPSLDQAQAMDIIATCYEKLRDPLGVAALDYLHSRGLNDQTIEVFRLGYSPGAKFEGLYVPRGVVMPCISLDEVFYIKICLLPGDPVKCKCGSEAMARRPCPKCGVVSKYRHVTGGKAALFNGDEMLENAPVLICEAEIDVMTAWQALHNVLAVVGLGGASNHPDLAMWGVHISAPPHVLIAMDNDKQGQEGARYLSSLFGSRAHVLDLPGGAHDINDFYMSGGDLWEWIKPHVGRLEYER